MKPDAMKEETFISPLETAESPKGRNARESGAERVGRIGDRASSQLGLTELASLARKAFDDRRPGDCLSLTRAILQIDPEHTEALEIQSRLRSNQDEELRRVRALLDVDNPWARYEAAQTLLSGILEVDPDNDEANALLPEVASQLSVSGGGLKPGALSPPRLVPEAPRSFVAVTLLVIIAVISVGGALGFADPVLQRVGLKGVREPVFQLLGLGGAAEDDTALSGTNDGWLPPATSGRVNLVVPPGTGIEMSVDGSTFEPLPPGIAPEPGLHTLEFRAGVEAYAALADPAAPESGDTRQTPPLPGVASPESNRTPPAEGVGSVPAPSPPPSAPVRTVTAPVASPATPAPTPPVTATPPVTDGRPRVTVQITARPWADVFLDGPERQPLGRTPLTDIQVPVGSILVFRSLGFVDRRYEVTAADKTIQITFP